MSATLFAHIVAQIQAVAKEFPHKAVTYIDLLKLLMEAANEKTLDEYDDAMREQFAEDQANCETHSNAELSGACPITGEPWDENNLP